VNIKLCDNFDEQVTLLHVLGKPIKKGLISTLY